MLIENVLPWAQPPKRLKTALTTGAPFRIPWLKNLHQLVNLVNLVHPRRLPAGQRLVARGMSIRRMDRDWGNS